MRSRETGISRDEGHYRKLAVVFPDLARLHRGLPVCSESALSAELQSSVPCSQFRDHAYAEEDEDLGEESSSLGRQLPLQYAPEEPVHSQSDDTDRSFAVRHPFLTSTVHRQILL